jgi:RimJ/RimL family protein N-acetyltransferase
MMATDPTIDKPARGFIPTIMTSRLRLRAFTLYDVEPLHRVMSGEEVLCYFPVTVPPTLEKTETFIRRQLEHWGTHKYGWWAVDLLTEDRLIGWAGLQYLPETDETEVAYLLARDTWGRGLAVEAAMAGLYFGFEALGRDTIIAVVHVDNARSVRVLDKLGMTRDRRDSYFGIEVYHYTLDRTTYDRALKPKIACSVNVSGS